MNGVQTQTKLVSHDNVMKRVWHRGSRPRYLYVTPPVSRIFTTIRGVENRLRGVAR